MDISGYSGSFPNQVIREPLHEQKGYYTSATGESEPRGRSSSIVGYPREAYPLRHPYEGRLEADYGVYKEKQQQFIEARSTYRELSDRSVGVNVPQGTRVYGSGRATTPPYHRQLAPLAAAAAGCAKVAADSRTEFTDQHIGRAYKGLEGQEGYRGHKAQMDQLLYAVRTNTVLEKKHTRFMNRPEYYD
ncbi:hypothetical protein MMC19_003912 [Ptychographa xylographoides]|nr:hypothetical protein [Ptychographa xylographoides]